MGDLSDSAETAVSRPTVSLVCSTIGRPTDLERLLDTLETTPDPSVMEFVLVDQSDDKVSTEMVQSRKLRFRAVTTTSARGLSRGRNAGIAIATGDILTFPDDNCWYDPDTVPRVVERFAREPSLDILAGIQLTDDGRPSMLRWSSEATPITRRNFVTTFIESSLFVHRRVIEECGGFDDDLGAGSDKGFMAGEGADLLLRALSHGYRAAYDPAIVIRQDDPRYDVPEGFTDKLYGYGRGTGKVFRRHHIPLARVGYYAARKAAAVAVRSVDGRRALAAADLAYLRGYLTGYRDGAD